MRSLFAATWAFILSEWGAAIVEYALALVLLSVVTLAAIAALGSKLSAMFYTASTSI